MLAERRYRSILQALRTGPIDPEVFERMAVSLANDAGLSVQPITGGTDCGFDGAIAQVDAEPGPLVVTIGKDVIGNLTRNLKRVALERPHATRIVAVVTSQDLSESRQNNLRTRARELGFVLVNVFDESAVAEFLYRNSDWSRTLLHIGGGLRQLSIFPVSRRPLHEIELLHRRHEIEWLQSSDDALIVGPPGSGKTSLLRHLALNGYGLFVVGESLGQVADELQSAIPKAIFVDDRPDAPEVCATLVRLRQELEVSFDIIATAWSDDPQIKQVLGINDSGVLGLSQLSQDEVADVVRASGLKGPEYLIQDIIRQAEGLPGLAVSLAQSCLRGDVREVLTGDVIAREFYVALTRIAERNDEAALVLAVLSVGGPQGMTLGAVAAFTGIPQPQIRALLGKLIRSLPASGFIAPVSGDYVAVRPRRLRSVFIRDYLLRPPAYDVEPLLLGAVSYADAVREMILASYAGARVDRLEEWVSRAPQAEVLAEYASLGAPQSKWVLTNYPEQAAAAAGGALRFIPELAIVSLLERARGDNRPLNSFPDHPLRLLDDWTNEAPGDHSIAGRKGLVLNTAWAWFGRGGDPEVAFRALASALSTDFRSVSVLAGAEGKMSIVWGIYSPEDILGIRELWRSISSDFAATPTRFWVPVLEALHGIAFPSVGDELAAAASIEASRLLAVDMIRDLASWGQDEPAILQRLSSISSVLGLENLVQVDRDFETLFGTFRAHRDWREQQEVAESRLGALAIVWAESDPQWVAETMARLLEQAGVAGGSGTDRTSMLCQLLAQRVGDPAPWLREFLNAGLPASCLSPFLDLVIASGGGVPTYVMEAIVSQPALQPAAVTLYLTGSVLDHSFADAVRELLPDHVNLVELYALRGEISEPVLKSLLVDSPAYLRQAAAFGMWKGRGQGIENESLEQIWRAAIVLSEADEHWLGEILGSDNKLAYSWLRKHQNDKEAPLIFRGDFLRSVTGGLTTRQRISLLRRLHARWRRDYVCDLVGEHVEVYIAALGLEKLGDLRLAALGRRPDDVWAKYVDLAVERGWQEDDIVRATLAVSRSWSGSASKMWRLEVAHFELFANDGRASVSGVAGACARIIKGEIEAALEREQHERIYGWGES